ncbi:hypothetical protein ACFWJ4_30565 [Kitasatospora sp. NPDC127067]|uniref:hypothetical protein n=1 Tax=Kitasatospora sp. NPDC127067 TaxID=3347126 RepID=UPI0036662AE2
MDPAEALTVLLVALGEPAGNTDEDQLRRIWGVAHTNRLCTSRQGLAQDEIEILCIALGAPARLGPRDEVVGARLGLAPVYAQSGHQAQADAQHLPILGELPALATELRGAQRGTAAVGGGGTR